MPCKIQVAILLLLPCHQKSQEQQRGLTDAGWKVTTCDVGTSITRLDQTSAVGWGDWIAGRLKAGGLRGGQKGALCPVGLSQLWGTPWAMPGTLQPGEGRERASQAPKIKPQVCFYQSINLAQPPQSALAWASIHPSRPAASSTHSSKNSGITLIMQE